MALVGFNFLKISAERKAELKGKIGVGNNVVLKKVSKSEIGIRLEKEQAIEIEFAFTSTYSPEVGKIEMVGKILLLEPKDVAEKIVAEWEKTKKLPPLMMQQVFTTILRKCNIQAIVMAEEIGLPSPIKLPEVHLTKGPAPGAKQVQSPGSKPVQTLKPAEQKKPEVQKKFNKIN